MSKDVWDIWWDFRGDCIVIQTNHPNYMHIDVILEVTCMIKEEFDEFEDWFNATHSDIKSGRISIHKWMKELGHARKS